MVIYCFCCVENKRLESFHKINSSKIVTQSVMATSILSLQLFSAVLISVLLISSSRTAASCYTSIISFGDSIADTGNLLLSLGGKIHIANPPYGETYFHHPTGRFSDGRVILDFFAEALGLPLVAPFLNKSKSSDEFEEGVNFAVGGATALDNSFFREKTSLDVTWTNYSLGVQMEWFKQLLPSLCVSRSDCNKVLHKSLFFVGEIGGNDYNNMFFQNKKFDEIKALVPRVIDTISSAINDLIKFGARTLVVPGNFPIGCSPAYLTHFQAQLSEDYDMHTGCIKWLNNFAEYHNAMLIEELDRIRQSHAYATIIYADYYNATLRLYGSPHNFGFEASPLVACCGGGGPYNYNSSVTCGNNDTNIMVCDDPSAYVSWDGVHYTEATYKTIARGLLNGSFTSPPINHICPTLDSQVNQSHNGL